MHVQDRAAAKAAPSSALPTTNGAIPPPSHLRGGYKFSDSKSLDFSTWFSANLSKLVVIFLLLSSLAAFLFLRNFSNPASLLCFQSHLSPSPPSQIRFPLISWSKIRPIAPNPSPTSNFRSDRWIVVSAPNSPSQSLQKLAKIRGWQLLIIGDSSTPSDFSLKGSIFLSLEEQSKLGFRILDHLPYHSYVRKSVGYLFAIQHGARKIFDADSRVEVLAGDLGSRFDLDLLGDSTTQQEILLQYSHEDPNRTVVNPYIHFGQRSVWPRGLPLESVGEISSEEFYTEIPGGKQFIQQGLSSGLPDVDSVFYFTRKSSSVEVFDIIFDDRAPKVALPQGIMAPVNSFNTLFHYQAFWGLFLPVTVSTMASDIIRGYFSQRILWEIGGHLVIYPPTVHRPDHAEAYPFAEEKDLHVNVGRLIKFLVNWRSRRATLFDRILDLSYRMAEERFWSEREVEFTAAWLQDLVAVGFQQPRLMALELDGPRGTIGHGDKKEFKAKKMPSMHLGVEEVGTVSYEIGNLIRWRKKLGNVVLVLFCRGEAEKTAMEWRMLYGRIFKTVVILAEKGSPELGVEQDQLFRAYRSLPKIFQQFSGAEGFLFLQDEMILNYWTLLEADTSKLWITNKLPSSWFTVDANSNASEWITSQTLMVKQVVNALPVHFQVNYKENIPDDKIVLCSSEIFYVPQRLVEDFVDLVDLVKDVDLHQMSAVPLFFLAMDQVSNFDSEVLASMSYRKKLAANENCDSVYSSKAAAVYPCPVSGGVDFLKLVKLMASGDRLLMELV